ncbi:hypothetical protein [Paenibacillus tyrfis]|uniref:Butirosin biosynthesis protein H N-terminal domain-containing protein n=1 Tax=Paenibacillus tyrfis TaxID=1501230 RepID=A0A081NTM8_9BACL|nr:hypothetical protein [Paenibacillus tyrfis]KEQ21801.1 hypothetical protein ET33_30785 [Paenibacillus tyrfis]
MSEKVLPICIPPIKGYQFFAYPLSVICTSEDYSPWLYSHFIQLFCNPNDILVSFYEPYAWYTTNPWFEFDKINHKSITSFGIDLNEIIIDYIDQGYYVLAIVDEFYVPKREAFQTFHLEHDILIFGYNRSNKTYNTIGYDNKGVFGQSLTSFNDFEKAFFNIKNNFILPYTLKNNFHYDFSVATIKEAFIDYLYSKNTSSRLLQLDERHYFSDHVFGLDTYDHLIRYFKLLLEKRVKYDIRSIHFLSEHKNCMLSRIEYLGRHGYLKDSHKFFEEFNIINNNIKISKNLQMKYLFTKKESAIQRITNILQETAMIERSLFEEMITKLS